MSQNSFIKPSISDPICVSLYTNSNNFEQLYEEIFLMKMISIKSRQTEMQNVCSAVQCNDN